MTTRTLPTPARLAASLASAVVLALGLLLGLVPGVGGSPAGAHDGPAIVVIEQVHPAGLQMHYIVRVTWEDDGHPAEDATVTATAIAADGTQLTPVALAPADNDGRYAGVVDYPSAGAWTVRVTSIEPTGSVEQPQEVTEPAATEPGDEASEVTTAPDDGGEGDDGFAPADDGSGDSDEAASDATAGSDDSDDDSGMPVYLLVAAAAVVVIGAATAVNIIRRNRRSPTAGADGDRASPAAERAPVGGGDPGGATDAAAGDGAPAGDVTPTSPSS